MPSTKDPIEQLDAKLRAIPSADVRQPELPMAVFNQQGSDLVAFLAKEPEVKSRLLNVGVPGDVLEALPLAMAASTAAEGAWQAVYSPRRPEEVAALESAASDLRSDTIAALRWNLRHDRVVQGTVDAIQEGTGAADLVQDLDALAVLIDNHAAAFAADKTFDAKERAKQCRERAKELRDAISGARADMTRAEAKDVRDRAYTYADDLLDEVRASARYAFRHEPELLVKFQDRYTTRRARRYRSAAAATVTAPPEPVDA